LGELRLELQRAGVRRELHGGRPYPSATSAVPVPSFGPTRSSVSTIVTSTTRRPSTQSQARSANTVPMVPYTADDLLTSNGTTTTPATLSASSPTAPTSAPGSNVRQAGAT